MAINYGVIEGQRDTDWIAGQIPYEIRNPNGDWTPYLPPGEWQKNSVIDSMACVTFSALNSIETQYKFLTGKDRNFSDRFTAKMSNTTTNGNYLWRVGDSIRQHADGSGDGLVDEIVWPTEGNFDWAKYYEPIPEFVKGKGKEFLMEWDVKYEFIDFNKDSLIYHLKQSPIQVVIPGHAVLNFLTTQQVIKYFDSYEPFIKETQSISSALKYVLTRKTMDKDLTRRLVEKLYKTWLQSDSGAVDYWTNIIDSPERLENFIDQKLSDVREAVK